MPLSAKCLTFKGNATVSLANAGISGARNTSRRATSSGVMQHAALMPSGLEQTLCRGPADCEVPPP